MILKEITNKEFEKYAKTHKLYTFHQTKEWAELKNKNGWDHIYVAMYNKDKIVGASLILSKKLPIIKKLIFYAPRGFLIDYHDELLVTEFTKQLKKLIKSKNGIFVKIDPTIIYQQRDIEGDIVDVNKNELELLKFLKKNGYHHYGLNISNYKELQPRWVFALPIDNKNEEEIYQNFNTRTKRSIKKCQNNGIIVEQMNNQELQLFKGIMEHTSSRRGFLDRPFSYYKNMIEILGDMCKIFIAYLDVDKAIDIQNNIIAEEEKKITQYQKNMESKKSQQGIEKSEETISNSKKEIENLLKLKEENGEKIPLSGAMFLQTGEETTYLFGGSYQKYMNYPSQYLVQWTAICDAIKNKSTLYNFYGIDGNIKEKGEMHGVYEFKRGFDGEVREYIGEFDLIINKPMYIIYTLMYGIYHGTKRIVSKIKK